MLQEESAVQVPLHPVPADRFYTAAQRGFLITVRYVVVLGSPHHLCICCDDIASLEKTFTLQDRQEHGRCPVPYGRTEAFLLFEFPDRLPCPIFLYDDGCTVLSFGRPF